MPADKSTESFLSGIDKKRDIVLSMDLDNTLVNRNKGDNYVLPDTLGLLKRLIKEPNFHLIPNTGRDIIGFGSFTKKTIDFPDAVLGAGSLIKIGGRYVFDSNSEIEWPVIKILLSGVESGVLPFVDFTHKDGRLLVYNNETGKKLKPLFFSQNPRSWFGPKLPMAVPVSSLDKKIKSVYRLEFPVLPDHKDLFDELVNRRENGVIHLRKLLGVTQKSLKDYTVKRKAFFNDEYKNKVSFARFEKHTDFSSKGHGIKIWLAKKKLKNPSIIHVGDQDYGVINDTLVKKELPRAKLVMAGDRCRRDNPLVDFYLSGDVDKAINGFIKSIHSFIKKI